MIIRSVNLDSSNHEGQSFLHFAETCFELQFVPDLLMFILYRYTLQQKLRASIEVCCEIKIIIFYTLKERYIILISLDLPQVTWVLYRVM